MNSRLPNDVGASNASSNEAAARVRLSFTATSIRSVAVIGLVLLSAVGCGGARLDAPSSAGASAAQTPESLHVITKKLSFGMTKPQVRHLVGPPTKIVRDPEGLSCWQYAVNQKSHGNILGPVTLSSVRVCFFAGVYTVAHFKFNGKWDYEPPPKVTF